MTNEVYTAYVDVTLSFSNEIIANSKDDAESYFNKLTIAEVMCMLKNKNSLKTNPSLEYEIEVSDVQLLQEVNSGGNNE
tara:strand:- start:38 stop:274 length:237 start_codon:yes stop_codon:yes gene_type:complete